MNKQELIKRAKPYFEKANINVMFATEDGNFFHKADRHYAFGHVSGSNMQVFTITREDLEGKPKEEETVEIDGVEYNLEGLKAVCDKKEINYVQTIGLKKLAEKYQKETEKKSDKIIEVNGIEYDLKRLKSICDERKIKYPKNIGLVKLAEKLEQDLENNPENTDKKDE